MFTQLIGASVAAVMVATPMGASVAEAQAQRTTTVTQRPNGTVVKKTTVRRTPARVNYRRFTKGQRFDRRYARNYGVVDYRRYRARRLYAPPRGYRWVRNGNDAVLVGITSGIVAATLANALR